MVIGGLITDNVTKSTSKIPFLGDIPILGWLFKTQTSNVEKDDLMIFITPYIIKNEGEASELTKQRNESLENFRKEYKIEKKEGLHIDLSSKVIDTPKQPASSATGTIGANPTPALKTGATPTRAEGIPAGTPDNQAPALKTEVTSTTQPPTSVETPKEGVR